MSYKPYLNAVGTDTYGRHAYSDENGRTYAVFPPEYPRFTGNLSICDIYKYGEMQAGDTLVDMLIWPSFNNKFTVGFIIKTVVSSDENENIYNVNTTSFSYELDENKNFLHNYTEEELQYYYEHEDIINVFYEKAYEMWGICEI